MAATSLLAIYFLLLGGGAYASPASRIDYSTACQAVEAAIGSSKVFYPGASQYDKDIYHNFGSSIQASACAVNPSTPEEVGAVLQVIGAQQVPFAVKGGGHSFAQTFSSTQGIHIDLSSFNHINYDADSQTVSIGPGQSWNTVYTALEEYGVTCIGARLPSVGVGGFLMGGGFGWLSNQKGLGIDNTLAFQLVLPSGEVVDVTAEDKPELFFALKGGGNNFGIVTSFTIKTFPQGNIWGGSLAFAADQIPAVTAAFANFAQTSDPKSSLAAYYLGAVNSTEVTALTLIFYDDLAPPPGLYDELLAIPAVSSNIKVRSLLDLVQNSGGFPYTRGLVEQVPVMTFPVPVLEAFQTEAIAMADTMKDANPVWIGYLIEPFGPTLLKHAPPGAGGYPTSAWPPTRDFAITTSAVWLGWNETSQDTLIRTNARASAARIRDTAITEGQLQAAPSFPDSYIYPNYATELTNAQQLYGSNLPLLQQIKKQYDPTNVMGLTGGVKITLAL